MEYPRNAVQLERRLGADIKLLEEYVGLNKSTEVNISRENHQFGFRYSFSLQCGHFKDFKDDGIPLPDEVRR
ncbi:hypothetical protein STEG23_027156, partial [Scotinomys teguina]